MSTDFTKLKIALISDELTQTSLESECQIKAITPLNYRFVLKYWQPDLFLVESCWGAYKNKWKYKIAAYPDYPQRNNSKLQSAVSYAKEIGIPTIFWNREDGVHFERFINSAKLFDYIFTTDSNVIPKYKNICTNAKAISPLTFVVNPKIHYPKNEQRINKFCFVGSYRTTLHEGRRDNQAMLLDSAIKYGLDIFDRNSSKKSSIFRFPEKYSHFIKPSVPYNQTGDIYNHYLGCLNVNTVTDSPTMFSRRVVEVMACKTPLITTNSLAMEELFKDYIFTVESPEHADECMKELSAGFNHKTLDKLEAGYRLILEQYTYNKWLEKILSVTKEG